MTEIVFDKARIAHVQHKIAAGSVTSHIKVVALATAKVAKAINARWLLDRDALVKQGFNSVDLDFVMKNVRGHHAIDSISSFTTTSELAHKFRVYRKGDDKRKAKRLMVSFLVVHSGSPFEVLEHLMKVGEGEGTYTLTPLQQELFAATADNQKRAKDAKPKPTKKPARKPQQQTLASAAEVNRRDSARRERKAKAKQAAGDAFLSDAPVVASSSNIPPE